MGDLNNIENKDLQKLFEDWDKAGVMPHTVMNLNSLLPKGTVTTAAGIAALAGTLLGKGISALGKQALMKRGFLKVLKRIGEIEEYIIDGKNAEKFKYSVKLNSGKSISSLKYYDEIKEKILEEIKNDTQEFEDFKNGRKGNADPTLNDQGTLVHIVNKYKKFFSNINRNFGQIKDLNGYGDSDEDIYNKLQETVKTNLNFANTYIETLIKKYKTRFTIGKEEDPNNNKRLEKYIMALNSAWETVKKEILIKYKKLAIDVNRSQEFKKLYDTVNDLYKTLPNTKNAVNIIMKTAAQALRLKPEWICVKDASNNYIINCINEPDNKYNYEMLHEKQNVATKNLNAPPIEHALDWYNNTYKTSYEKAKDTVDFTCTYDSSNGKIRWYRKNDIFYIPENEFITNNIPLPKQGDIFDITIHWTCEFDDSYGSNIGKGSYDILQQKVKLK